MCCAWILDQSFYFQAVSTDYILGALAKLRKSTTSFVMSVCLSVLPSFRMEQLRSHWMDFYEIWYLRIFRKICREKFIFDSNLTRTTDMLTTYEYLCPFVVTSLWIFLGFRNILDKRLRRKPKHAFYFQYNIFRKKKLALYEITWENIVEPDRSQMTI